MVALNVDADAVAWNRKTTDVGLQDATPFTRPHLRPSLQSDPNQSTRLPHLRNESKSREPAPTAIPPAQPRRIRVCLTPRESTGRPSASANPRTIAKPNAGAEAPRAAKYKIKRDLPLRQPMTNPTTSIGSQYSSPRFISPHRCDQAVGAIPMASFAFSPTLSAAPSPPPAPTPNLRRPSAARPYRVRARRRRG